MTKHEIKFWSNAALENAAEAFKALGHPARIKIVAVLTEKGCSVNELVDALEMKQAVVSQHLRRLWSQGLLTRERDGNRIIYRLAKPEVSAVLSCLRNCLVMQSSRKS